jgi:hypothetical protein
VTRAAGRFAAALLLATAPVLLPASGTPAHADADDCVGIVVDGRLLGGTVLTGCADGDPDSGFDALRRAGFAYTPRPRDGLVCQIDGAPACSDTTTTTYWSYWWRAPGSVRWRYATEGPATHDPAPGSTEAWVWQEGGRRPPPDVALATICPQAAEAEKPSPKPSKKQPSERPSAAASDRSTAAPSRPATSRPGPKRSRTKDAVTPAEPTGGPTSGESSAPPTVPSSPAASPGDLPTDDAVRAEVAAGSGTPWLGLGAGGALILALGGAALWRFRGGSP